MAALGVQPWIRSRAVDEDLHCSMLLSLAFIAILTSLIARQLARLLERFKRTVVAHKICLAMPESIRVPEVVLVRVTEALKASTLIASARWQSRMHGILQGDPNLYLFYKGYPVVTKVKHRGLKSNCSGYPNLCVEKEGVHHFHRVESDVATQNGTISWKDFVRTRCRDIQYHKSLDIVVVELSER